MKPRTQMQEALAHLRQLIELGAEFPDAVYSTSVAFELNTAQVQQLQDLYDNK